MQYKMASSFLCSNSSRKQKVYDITVVGTHCFFANMFLSIIANHAAARQYKSLLSNYPDAYVLGLTATPERLDGKGMMIFSKTCWR